jgi:hypothetical protein
MTVREYRDEVDVSKLYAACSALAHAGEEAGQRLNFGFNGVIHRELTAIPPRSGFSLDAWFRRLEIDRQVLGNDIVITCEHRRVGIQL